MRRDKDGPTIIPPGEPLPSESAAGSGLDDTTLEFLAGLLDDYFRIPGTSIRFGLDPLVGMIPGIGDMITGMASFLIILAAWQRRLPRVTVARMITNVVIDSLIGIVPVAGDAFDVAWKSNRKNLQLLKRAEPDRPTQSWRDWAFLAGIVLLLGVVVAIPIVIALLVVEWLKR